MATNPILAGLDDFVFQGIGYGKPPVLAIDPEQSRIGLNEFFKEFSPTTAIIRDADELTEHLELIDTAIKYVKPAKKLASYGKAVLEGLSVSQEGLSYGLNGILNMQAPSASSTGLPTLYVVDEDSINPDRFSEFMSRFQQLGHEKKPRVVVVANKTLDSALRLVSACGENIDAHVLSATGLKQIGTLALECRDFVQFVDLFLTEGDGYCSSTDVVDLFPSADMDSRFRRCLGRMLKVQSLFRTNRKFEATDGVMLLANEIEQLSSAAHGDEFKNKLLCMKAISNLWTSYLTETNPELIENSLSIADHLKDDLLKAHCLKLTGLVTGRSKLTHQLLVDAQNIFETCGEVEQAIFVETNILENNLFSERIDVERAMKLIDFVSYTTPYIRRSTTIFSNAAIALMLAGNTVASRDAFGLATSAAGPSVNLLTSEVNALIAGYIDGEDLDREAVLKLTRRILRSGIDRNFSYHQALMFANLLKMSEGDREISGHIQEILRKERFLKYDEFLEDAGTLVKYVATKSYDLTATRPANLGGVLGAFLERHELFPAPHVFYR
ncbi:MAG: hypothetical protein AAGG47_16885 [Pseudomonadota bacterium]